MPFLASCQKKHDQRIAQRLPELRRELVEEYRKIHQKAPNARIIIVGYPQLFVDDPSDQYDDLLFAQDQRWMNQKAAELNAMLASAAQEAGAEFVDPTDAFRGHGIGSSDPWINDLDIGGPGLMVYDPGSFHPNAAGHAALAHLSSSSWRTLALTPWRAGSGPDWAHPHRVEHLALQVRSGWGSDRDRDDCGWASGPRRSTPRSAGPGVVHEGVAHT